MNEENKCEGFILGETVRYKQFSESGRFKGFESLKVIEIRTFLSTGRKAAIGENSKGRKQWLYAEQKA